MGGAAGGAHWPLGRMWLSWTGTGGCRGGARPGGGGGVLGGIWPAELGACLQLCPGVTTAPWGAGTVLRDLAVLLAGPPDRTLAACTLAWGWGRGPAIGD